MIAALVASALVVVSAVYAGDLPPLIRGLFPGRYAVIVGGLVLGAAVVALAAAAARIRAQWAPRFAVLGLAAAAAAAYLAAFRTGNVDVDVVEAFHFIEYGIVGALFYRAWRRTPDPRCLVYPLLAGTIVGVVDEWLQWWVPSRVGELHDVALDAMAAAVGVAVAAAAAPPHPHGLTVRPQSARLIARAVTVVLVLIAAFVATVHMGYEVRDPEIGAFRSRYDASTLQFLAADRARVWQFGLPAAPGRFAREDHFQSEALWHVEERNDATLAGDWQTAWRENLILEKYYTPIVKNPFLAQPYAWPAEERADIERRIAAAPALAWESRAPAIPIWTWR